MDSLATVLFLAAFATVLGYFAYRVLRHGGFKAAMFGASIEQTVGEVAGERQGSVGVGLKVHALRRDGTEKLVGLEVVAKSAASYQMLPITLSLDQAQQLASLLQAATRIP
jgi:hypothetical protein